jgi:hypothetical protein
MNILKYRNQWNRWITITKNQQIFLIFSILSLANIVQAHPFRLNQNDLKEQDVFRQLDELWPTANHERLSSGAPGTHYWQQKVDYQMKIRIDEDENRLTGEAIITYHNESPHALSYLWLQLDQNHFAHDSIANQTRTSSHMEKFYYGEMREYLLSKNPGMGFQIHAVQDLQNLDLRYQIVDTMMRIDLNTALASKQKFQFKIKWQYQIGNAKEQWGRSGFEILTQAPKDRKIYEIAQFFPRMAAYTDTYGWQNKQFLGNGEFTLEFGDYEVEIDVPNTHVVASTGELINPIEVLSKDQIDRLAQAKTATKPMMVITKEEAIANQSLKATARKTWRFKATQVRDFAFATSSTFIWDAWGYQNGDQNTVMAMSFYPNDAYVLWSKYSTQAIVHTLETYEKFTFSYPYPVAISVNGPVGGMEYPMICFNGPRPEEDGTYSQNTKYGLISVVIHEVGHFFFPMIVNSDERQWTWMDEGINTFLQFQAERTWEDDYPSWDGQPHKIVNYMKSEKQVPIMTQSDSLVQFGNNAYAKPAAALSILRESIMGEALFDHAFKTYANRWKFKRPYPADFFRSMEDASAVDLDWFWRSWFYSILPVDIEIASITQYRLKTKDPKIDKIAEKEEKDAFPQTLVSQRNQSKIKRVDRFPELKDFYNQYDPLNITWKDEQNYQSFLSELKDWEKAQLQTKGYFYRVIIKNKGGTISHLPLLIEFEDGQTEIKRIPPEIWRKNQLEVALFWQFDQPIKSLSFDPYLETADIDISNNQYPRKILKDSFELLKQEKSKNAMKQALDEAKEKLEKEKLEKEKLEKEKLEKEKLEKEKNSKSVIEPKTPTPH